MKYHYRYNKRMIIAIVAIVVISLAGIAYHFYSLEEQKESAPATNIQFTLLYVADSSDGESYATIEHDNILNVTCWKSSMLSRYCVPDNQLDQGAQQKLAELLNKSKN